MIQYDIGVFGVILAIRDAPDGASLSKYEAVRSGWYGIDIMDIRGGRGWLDLFARAEGRKLWKFFLTCQVYVL
ncbi:MAG: hypothetical protein HPY71_05800 [Firmicutes bacterium]|nr:hypothetical protein [Bacillota bacterium]